LGLPTELEGCRVRFSVGKPPCEGMPTEIEGLAWTAAARSGARAGGSAGGYYYGQEAGAYVGAYDGAYFAEDDFVGLG
jgi:hypothetical protein